MKTVNQGRNLARKPSLISKLLLAFYLGSFAVPAWTEVPLRNAPPAGAELPFYAPWGIDLTARDTSIRPGDDFWRYANGTWLAKAHIPADREYWGAAAELQQRVKRQLAGVIAQAAADAHRDPISRQLSDVYSSWMDEAGIAARGASVLKPYLAQIAAVRSRDELIRLMATPGMHSPLGISVWTDPRNPDRHIVRVRQSGLGMPGRGYYLREEPPFDRYRAQYRKLAITLQKLSGISDVSSRTDAILALERQIAEAHWPLERTRDVNQTTNIFTFGKLVKLAPNLNWPLILKTRGLSGVDSILVQEPSAIEKLSELVAAVPLQTWKDWVSFHFIRTHADYLPSAFDDASFRFYSTALEGIEKRPERSARGLELLNETLRDSLGRLYVRRHYSAKTRQQMLELVENVRSAFLDSVTNVRWMDESTRAHAVAKLQKLQVQIGHPQRYVDYTPLRIRPDDLLGNMVRAAEFKWSLQKSRLAKPVDSTIWDAGPQEVAGYYSWRTNQITFTAAILGPPFFDPAADPAVNYGGIGVVIAHELTHAFDQRGRHFDADGRKVDWWSPSSNGRFTALAKQLVEQFNQYEPLPGQRVNGELTISDNLADLGGIEVAYKAYQRHVQSRGERPPIEGFSGDQRFLLAFAQLFREKMRDEALAKHLLTDEHSPYEFRTNGIVRNFDPWYRAFDVQPDNRLYFSPVERVRLWQ